MKYLRYVFIGWLVLVLSGCNVAYTTRPIGDKPVKLEKDEWKGTWLMEVPDEEGGTVLFTRVVDSDKGVLKVAGIEPDSTDLTVDSFDAHIRSSGNWTFLSMPDTDNPDEDRYTWCRIEKGGKRAIIWAPDVDKFKELVEAGKLPGKVHNGNVTLDELTADHMKLIRSDEEGVLFHWDEFIIVTRIGQ